MQQREAAIIRDRTTCELCLALENSCIKVNIPLLEDFNEITEMLMNQIGRPLGEVCQRLYSWSKEAIEDFETSRDDRMALSGFHFKMTVRFLLEEYKADVDASLDRQIKEALLATKPAGEIYNDIMGFFRMDPSLLSPNEKKMLAALKAYEVIGHRKKDSDKLPQVTLEMFPSKVVPVPQKLVIVRAVSPTVSLNCTLL